MAATTNGPSMALLGRSYHPVGLTMLLYIGEQCKRCGTRSINLPVTSRYTGSTSTQGVRWRERTASRDAQRFATSPRQPDLLNADLFEV